MNGIPRRNFEEVFEMESLTLLDPKNRNFHGCNAWNLVPCYWWKVYVRPPGQKRGNFHIWTAMNWNPSLWSEEGMKQKKGMILRRKHKNQDGMDSKNIERVRSSLFLDKFLWKSGVNLTSLLVFVYNDKDYHREHEWWWPQEEYSLFTYFNYRDLKCESCCKPSILHNGACTRQEE